MALRVLPRPALAETNYEAKPTPGRRMAVGTGIEVGAGRDLDVRTPAAVLRRDALAGIANPDWTVRVRIPVCV